LKNNGKMVYSTCTINKKENEQMIKKFLDKYPDMKIVEERKILPFVYDSDGFYMCKLEKGKKQVIRKMYVNVREKMKEWGVEAEKGEGIKEEEKQRQYDEMIELRRQQRKKIQSKGADCTNLKEYQQEVIKIRDFLQITMVILITVLLIWTGLSAEEGERIPILILEFLIDAPLLFFSSKVVTLSKEG